MILISYLEISGKSGWAPKNLNEIRTAEGDSVIDDQEQEIEKASIQWVRLLASVEYLFLYPPDKV